MPKRTKEQMSRDIRIVSGTPEGERLLGELYEKNFVFTSTFDPNPTVAAFNEGRRAAALDFIALLVNAPERFKPDTIRRIAAQAEGNDL